ncbi:MAG: hypothetical protein CM1200mP15_05280 [Dehalococcoidia bacterium]|nr:MAG: hypothetical protein CM1200mP15_05280 [Dehalococcoidia bacterium]
MDVTVKIKRYDPESNNSDYVWQEYPIAIDENATVLDALIQIREDDDGTLSLRCSCRSAICGSCAMKINGQGVWPVRQKLLSLWIKTGSF